MAQAIKANCYTSYHASRSSGFRHLNEIHFEVIHSEEAPNALGTARYFANPAPPPPEGNGPAGSAHRCLDDVACYRTLGDDEIPWGAASASGISANLHGIHNELAGYARWLGATWLLHRGTLKRAAFKTALDCKKYKIPVVFCFASDLAAGKHGITTHAEISKASRAMDPGNSDRYTHSDPGIFFPRRYFMRLVRSYYAELNV